MNDPVDDAVAKLEILLQQYEDRFRVPNDYIPKTDLQITLSSLLVVIRHLRDKVQI